MKLILCPDCDDIFKLSKQHRECACGSSYGRLHNDGLHADIGGDGIPIGFANGSLLGALSDRPRTGLGSRFMAFVIPTECNTIHYLTNGEGK